MKHYMKNVILVFALIVWFGIIMPALLNIPLTAVTVLTWLASVLIVIKFFNVVSKEINETITKENEENEENE